MCLLGCDPAGPPEDECSKLLETLALSAEVYCIASHRTSCPAHCELGSLYRCCAILLLQHVASRMCADKRISELSTDAAWVTQNQSSLSFSVGTSVCHSGCRSTMKLLCSGIDTLFRNSASGLHERTKCVRCIACRDVRYRNRKKPIDPNIRGTRALLDGSHDVRWFSMDAFMVERTSSLAEWRHSFVYPLMVPARRALV
jgi:hypothetical protein